MISTLSSFYYGHTITAANQWIDFKEGVTQYNAQIPVGQYSLTDFAAKVAEVMTTEGGQVYSASVNRTTRKITISAAGNFELLCTSGTNIGQDAFSLIGFTGTDKTGSNSYLGTVASGYSFAPQFWLQDFIGKEDWQEASDGVRNEAASGAVEVVTFGNVKKMQFRIIYQQNNVLNSPIITSSATGLDDLRAFMQYAITLAPIEINYDASTPSTFDEIRLESTPVSRSGLGYKLIELYDKGLSDVFETGILTWRVFS